MAIAMHSNSYNFHYKQLLFFTLQVLEELLAKLDIEHVSWTTDKRGYFHQVLFPLQSGEPCETTLHCLTELGIGTKLNSSVR